MAVPLAELRKPNVDQWQRKSRAWRRTCQAVREGRRATPGVLACRVKDE